MMQVHGGDIYQIAKIFGLLRDEIIDFSANINPLGPSQRAINEIKKNIYRIKDYPDPEVYRLRELLSEYYGISPGNILVGNGSTELIYLIPQALDIPNVFILSPTFSEYERASRISQRMVYHINVNGEAGDGFSQAIDILIERVMGEKKAVVFICNPNNPTGRLIPKKNILKVISKLSGNDRFIVIDEAFIDYNEKESLISESIEHNNIIVLRSFTKFFALPGLRIGYMTSNSGIIKYISQFKEPWSVNSLACIAAEESLKDEEYIKESRLIMEKERPFLYNEVAKMRDIYIYPSEANFFLIELNNGMTSTELFYSMAKERVLIRDCKSFYGLGDNYIRIAIKSHRENMILVEILDRAIKGVA